MHVVYFPTIWNRFFNISKRFSKKCSAHLELVCKVIRTYFQMLSRILNSFSKSEALLYCGTLCTLCCPEHDSYKSLVKLPELEPAEQLEKSARASPSKTDAI